MNTFLEEYKADRWNEKYFQYKPEDQKGTTAYYITVPPDNTKAFEMVEAAINNSVESDHVVGINVRSVVDIFDNSKVNQIIRFDYDKEKAYKWYKPEGAIS